METQEIKHYNARPSTIPNLGLDVYGAHRHNFDTYETNEEREKRKASDRRLKELNEALKAEILKESPSLSIVEAILKEKFFIAFNVRLNEVEAYLRTLSKKGTEEALKQYRKIAKASNRLTRDLWLFKATSRGFQHYIYAQRKKLKPKNSFTEVVGRTFNWSKFEQTKTIETDTEYLKANSKAIQFGNSVTDKERSYIIKELASFLKAWNEKRLPSLSELSWAFGARGKRGSVAYYKDSLKLISINRNNIGSLVHEVGHYLDHLNNDISKKISKETLVAYRDYLRDSGHADDISYYLQRSELFARAVEAYLLGQFSEFAQVETSYLPKLNDELTALVKEALGEY
jgi:hypothetical protein